MHKRNSQDKNLANIYLLRYKNTCNYVLQNLKNQYNAVRLEQSSGDLKRTWITIKTICNIDTPKSKTHCDLRNHLGNTLRNSANVMNNYFTSIGSDLAGLLSTRATEENLKAKINHVLANNTASFYLNPTDPIAISKTILTFKTLVHLCGMD